MKSKRIFLYIFNFIISFLILIILVKYSNNIRIKIIKILYYFIGLYLFILLLIFKIYKRKIFYSFLFSFLGIVIGIIILFDLQLKDKIYKTIFNKFIGIRSEKFHHIYEKNKIMYQGIFENKPVFVRTNEDGLRTDYSRSSFLKYKRRIVIMGDSFTFGFKVDQDNTFSYVIERNLRKKFSSLAVLNAGIISYSPFLEKILFKKVLKQYSPQIVLLFLDCTDIGDDIKYSSEAQYKNNDIFFKDMKHYNYSDFKLKIDNKIEKNRFFIYKYPLSKTKKYFENTFKNIKELASIIKMSNSKFILVIAPRSLHWNMKECPDNWEKNEYSFSDTYKYEYFNFFNEKKDEVDFKIYDLLNDFKKTKDFPLVFKNDPHWNIKGHKFVSKIISELIFKQLKSQ